MENFNKIKFLYVSHGQVFFKSSYTDAIAIRAVGNTERNTFRVPDEYLTLKNLAENYNLDDNFLKYIKTKFELRELMGKIKTPIYDSRLRPYQNEGVKLIRSKGSYGIFWQMRTGKTPTTIVGADIYDKVVYAVPSGLVANWAKEFNIWTKRKDLFIVKENSTKKIKLETLDAFNNAKTGILLVSKDTINKYMQINITRGQNKGVERDFEWKPKKFNKLVIDEAHFLRHNNSKQSHGMKTLRAYAEGVITLTGTPATAGAHDVIALLQMLWPGRFAKWFLIDYFFIKERNKYSEFGKPLIIHPDKEEEWAHMLSEYSSQIKMNDVVDWLPPVMEMPILLEKDKKQAKVFHSIVNEFRYKDKDGKTQREASILTQISRLIQIGLSPAMKNIEGESPKTQWLKKFVKENPKEPIIIVSTSRVYIDHLKKNYFKKALMLVGGMTDVEKNKSQELFNAGHTNIMLAVISVAKEGFTLDRANTIIFANKSWNPTENEQVQARFMPVNKENVKGTKFVYYLNLEDSMDQHVQVALDNKLSKTEIVNNYMDWVRNKKWK